MAKGKVNVTVSAAPIEQPGQQALNHRDRMFAIVDMLFHGKGLTREDVRGYMLAFAGDEIPTGASDDEVAESISQQMISKWRSEIISHITAHNEKQMGNQLREYEETIRRDADDKLSALID